MKTATAEAKWLRRQSAVATRGISLRRLDELVAAGEIEARRDGRCIYIKAASLDAWIEGLPEA